MPPHNQRSGYLADRGTYATQDLADQFVRAAALVAEEGEIKKLVAERQKWHPGKSYIGTGGGLAGVSLLAWIALGWVAAAAGGPRVGRPVAVLLALAATLLICTTIVAVAGWRDYREHRRGADWDLVRAHDEARLRSETSAEVQALSDKVDQLVEAVEALALGEPSPMPEAFTPNGAPKRDWPALARLVRDPNSAPEGVTPLIEGRPGRNRSTS